MTDPPRERATLPAVPLALRFPADVWRLLQPYQALIRFAAMLVLMAAGGMSLVLIMGGGPRSADAPLPSTSTSADQSTTAVESEPHAAELDHPIDTATAPDAATTSIEPTAVGPAAPSSHAVMAIETAQAQITPAYPTTPYPEAVLPETADNSLPQVRTSEPAVARLRGNVLETQPR